MKIDRVALLCGNCNAVLTHVLYNLHDSKPCCDSPAPELHDCARQCDACRPRGVPFHVAVERALQQGAAIRPVLDISSALLSTAAIRPIQPFGIDDATADVEWRWVGVPSGLQDAMCANGSPVAADHPWWNYVATNRWQVVALDKLTPATDADPDDAYLLQAHADYARASEAALRYALARPTVSTRSYALSRYLFDRFDGDVNRGDFYYDGVLPLASRNLIDAEMDELRKTAFALHCAVADRSAKRISKPRPSRLRRGPIDPVDDEV